MVLTLSKDEMYEIVLRRDKDFDGVFFYGAYDSEVYCLPSCSGRIPIRQKIRFYSTREEAEAQGHRPCRRCRPDTVPMKDPNSVWFRSGKGRRK